jgi:tetratricopeptide (TPR) repeat protein/mono/diheme cytochrome c family protein
MKFYLVLSLAVLPGAVELLGQTGTPLTFNRDIAPVVYRSCASCHRAGGSGPFPLVSYADVRGRLREVVTATAKHHMPPWLPEDGFGDFDDATRRLTPAEIKLLSDWANSGAAEGSPEDKPAPPPVNPQEYDGWTLGKPDLVIQAQQPVSVPATGADLFWNFVFSPAISSTRYVRAVDIRPGGPHMVHHANLVIDRYQISRKKEKTPGAGFPGMDLDPGGSVFDPPGHFLFWKPGSGPDVEPDGYAWRLEPGNDLILNAHLRPAGMQMMVQPSIALYFTDQKPTHAPLLIELDRDDKLDIPPGVRDFVVSDDLRLPVDVDVLAIYPHAHYLGKLLEGYATLPDGKRQWLIRVPDWDFDLQAVFRYKKPVFLPAGTVVSLRYHYDNSALNPHNPSKPPRRVRGGNNGTDEMSHLWLQVLPRGPGDRRREIEEAVMQRRIEKDPRDSAAYLDLGEIRLSRLDTQGAITALDQAVRIAPNDSQAHNILGASLSRVGRSVDALGQFETALRLDESNVNARYNLVFALIKAGQTAEAAQQMEKVVAAFPKDASLHNLWGELLVQERKFDEAVAQFDEAIRLDPAGNAGKAAQANRAEALASKTAPK